MSRGGESEHRAPGHSGSHRGGGGGHLQVYFDIFLVFFNDFSIFRAVTLQQAGRRRREAGTEDGVWAERLRDLVMMGE